MTISPARVAAFDVLLRVETEQAHAVELLHSEKLAKLDVRDRNLAMQIVMGTLRWQSRLDEDLGKFVTDKNNVVAKLDGEVRAAMRMAAFQLRFLDRVPSSAAVNDSVEMVKRARKRSAAPLVNAVLRKLAAAPKAVERSSLESAREIAEGLAHPLWMVERWVRTFGRETTRRICEADQEQPATSLRPPLEQATAEKLERELAEEGVELSPGLLLKSARRVLKGEATATAAFREQRTGIQDEASQLVAALVGEGERILDCCAAPGGKTQAIAMRNPQAKIVAAELHPQRARLMQKLVTARNVEIIASDVAHLQPDATFDRVLADVPCSGTGTLARNPEIKWRLKPDDLVDLQRRQIAILDVALDRAAQGARIVYSTCSLEREENEDVIAEVLSSRADTKLIPVSKVLDEISDTLVMQKTDLLNGVYLRTLPGVHPCDGFFAAVMEKISA